MFIANDISPTLDWQSENYSMSIELDHVGAI